MAITRENYFWHKLHSLTGIIPIGFYMLQHLTVNSFSLAGPGAYNGVVGFFGAVPKHILFAVEILVLWLPLLFHAVYGIFIVGRMQPNYLSTKYKFSENLQYSLQRYTGVLLFFLLIAHVVTTTMNARINGEHVIQYAAWRELLTSSGYIWLIVYMTGILAASYHLAYGLWNFCIRWGITVSDRSQKAMQKFAVVMFVAVTVLGWMALFGFLMGSYGASEAPSDGEGPINVASPLS
jgi:succinate dehydrogenase / fumarate reductase, cytochrome b subunit